jgi:hypothetical protein
MLTGALAAVQLTLMTGLTRSRFQTLLCLRQHGNSHFICFSFFRPASEKTNNKKKIKYRSVEG